MSKGDKIRVSNYKAYFKNHDDIDWGKKDVAYQIVSDHMSERWDAANDFIQKEFDDNHKERLKEINKGDSNVKTPKRSTKKKMS